MRTIDGDWRPGRKKAEELLSETPTMEEKEAFIMAKLDEIFENQVGVFTIFKAEMLDHFLLSIEEQVGDTNDKDAFCKAYYKTYKDLGGALMVRSMGYHSMHMSYKHLHRGFFFWLFQNKYAVSVMLSIMLLNAFIFDLYSLTIKALVFGCILIWIGIMVKSYYNCYHKLKDIPNDNTIISSYKLANNKVFGFSLVFSIIFQLPSFGIDKVYVLIILMPLIYMITFYFIYIVKRHNDLTSKKTAPS